MLDQLTSRGVPTVGIGKIDDLFAGRGLTVKIHTHNNADGMKKTNAALDAYDHGLIFTNLVEFDMVWGHRNDPSGFAEGLRQFDDWLGQFITRLGQQDALFIVADHGIDPTTPSTDHSRELIPLLVHGPSLARGVDLGTRDTYADLAATLGELFGMPDSAIASTQGTSFYRKIMP